jgi:nicotinamide mononucleotide adenylyltransferase
MCELAASQTSNWLMIDPWEAMQSHYVPTAQVLDHFEEELNRELGPGVESADGTEYLKPRVAVLAGADLIQTMSTPGLWDSEDLDHILGKFGVFIVERSGTDMDSALSSLQQWKDNIYVIQQVFQNNVSSTQVRLHLKRDMSVRYLIPECVIDYIEERGLYQDGGIGAASDGQGKEKDGPSRTSSGGTLDRLVAESSRG